MFVSVSWVPQHRISNVAYNVVNGLCTPIPDRSAPVYVTIGDGGNLEGLATKSSLGCGLRRLVHQQVLAPHGRLRRSVRNKRRREKLVVDAWLNKLRLLRAHDYFGVVAAYSCLCSPQGNERTIHWLCYMNLSCVQDQSSTSGWHGVWGNWKC
jgi:hypothetical protein